VIDEGRRISAINNQGALSCPATALDRRMLEEILFPSFRLRRKGLGRSAQNLDCSIKRLDDRRRSYRWGMVWVSMRERAAQTNDVAMFFFSNTRAEEMAETVVASGSRASRRNMK
jgi:hypothetical protein